jgi:hypothetical protein
VSRTRIAERVRASTAASAYRQSRPRRGVASQRCCKWPGARRGHGVGSFESCQDEVRRSYAVGRTVPPSAEIEERIDRLLSVGVGENPRESLSELARLGARLIIQRAVEDEFDAWLGRARYERRPDHQRGLRNCGSGLRNGFRARARCRPPRGSSRSRSRRCVRRPRRSPRPALTIREVRAAARAAAPGRLGSTGVARRRCSGPGRRPRGRDLRWTASCRRAH